MAVFLAALLAGHPFPSPAAEKSTTPRLSDAFPHPRLTADRLDAALSLGREVVHFDALSSNPRLDWAVGLTLEPVFCTRATAPAGKPLVLLVDARGDDLDAGEAAGQRAIRRLLERLPPHWTTALALDVDASLDDMALLRAAPNRGVADLFLDMGALSAAQHWSITAPFQVRLAGTETPEETRRFLEAWKAARPARDAVAVYTEALLRALEPMEQRSLTLELWALEKNRAAYDAGEIPLAQYLQRLLAVQGRAPAPRQVMRFMDLSALEEGLDLELAEAERDRLAERLNLVTVGRPRSDLLRASAAFAEHRLSPSRHAAELFRLASAAGIPKEDYRAYFQFFRYADLAEQIDPAVLRREVGALEEDRFGPASNTPGQAGMLRLAQDARALRRAVVDGAFPADAPWDAWKSIPARAEAAARLVDLEAPRPVFSWEKSMDLLRDLDRTARERGERMADRVLSAADGNATFLASGATLRAAEERLALRGAGVMVLHAINGKSAAPDALQPGPRFWDRPRVRWDGNEAARGAAAALWESLAVVLACAQSRPIRPADPALARRYGLRVRTGPPRRHARGGEVRVSVGTRLLPRITVRWRWLAADAAGGAGPGFTPLPAPAGARWRLFALPEAGLRGPLRWGAAQVRAVKSATRRFFEMQKRATLLTGAWMTGGVILSFFAGVVSSVLIAAWLVVGVLVLVGVVVFGRNKVPAGDWAQELKSFGRERKGFWRRPAEDAGEGRRP